MELETVISVAGAVAFYSLLINAARKGNSTALALMGSYVFGVISAEKFHVSEHTWVVVALSALSIILVVAWVRGMKTGIRAETQERNL